MESSEFTALCDIAKPIKITGDSYSITILFDNKIEVEIKTETEWDSPYLSFDTNLEKEERDKEYRERKMEEAALSKKQQEKRDSIRSMIDPVVWEKIKDSISIK